MHKNEGGTSSEAAPKPEAARATAAAKVFDFTLPIASMDEATREAYFLLNRKASFGPPEEYESKKPEGKTMTLAEVETALGSTIKEARIPKQCC